MRTQSRTTSLLAGTVVLSLSLACAAAAQSPPQGSIAAPSDKDCKKAAHIVEKGKPDKKEEWAFATIIRCPDDASAAGAKAIRQMRNLSDTASLNAAWVPLFRLVDPGLMAAYVDVLGDRAASAAARSLAASALLTMQGDGMVGASDGSLTRDGENCQVGYAMAPPPTIIAPLTAVHRQAIRATLTAVAADATAPASVRSAVACVRGHLRPMP